MFKQTKHNLLVSLFNQIVQDYGWKNTRSTKLFYLQEQFKCDALFNFSF